MAVFLIDGPSLRHAVGDGFRTQGVATSKRKIREGFAGRAIEQRQPVRQNALAEADPHEVATLGIDGEGFVAFDVVPLIAKGQPRGVIELYHRTRREEDPEWREFLEVLAHQSAIAVDNSQLLDALQRTNTELTLAYDATIEGWARALDLRDKETEGHTRRVTELSLKMAKAFGLGEEATLHLRRGAMLHDIGKMGIPDRILLKPGPLDADELEIMRQHPKHARDWLEPIPYLRPALEIPYGHHERWDGNGYPLGLSGDKIPLSARIFAAVDIWDALRSDRPYREAWSTDQVRDHMLSLSGTHLDPNVVSVFLTMIDQDTEPDEPSASHPIALARSLATVRREYRDRRDRDRRLADRLRHSNRRGHQFAALTRSLRAENARLSELATTDDLTGLKNRRYFREALESAFARSTLSGEMLSVILIDVDHFKRYNDTYGHAAGDDVLRAVAQVLRMEVPVRDVAARIGGEEFAVVLHATDAPRAMMIAERLRRSIADWPWNLRPITVSLGVATRTGCELSPDVLVQAADRALYQSKQRDRNCVSYSEEFLCLEGV